METSRAAASFAVYCHYRGLRPKTLEFYRWGLSYLEAECPELPKDHRRLLPILGNRRLAPESRRCLERVLGRFFRWVAKEYGEPNPMLPLEKLPKRKTLPRVLTLDEVNRVWNVCETERDLGMIAVVLDTGIRLGEIANLRKEDLVSEHLIVDGKVGKRRVPMTPWVRDLLLELGDSTNVWVSRRGNGMTRVGVQKAFQRILKDAGLSGAKLGPHLLRHTFATEYCRSGGNVRILQEIMGHEHLETTMVYVHLAGRDAANDHAIHSPAKKLILVDLCQLKTRNRIDGGLVTGSPD